MVQVREALHKAIELLHNSDTARLDAEVLLSSVLRCDRLGLLSKSNDTLDQNSQDIYQQILARRISGEPIAYILGVKEFWSLDFFVSPAVLIPRPDTEILVEEALRICNAIVNPTLCDLGTGSGCIAISVAHELQKHGINPSIVATDISEEALHIAKQNTQRHHISEYIEFRLGNWCEALPNKKFDLIVSNPPYIAREDVNVSPETAFEPDNALYADNEGLAAYREIFAKAKNYLKPGGVILCEIGATQGAALSDLARVCGFSSVNIIPDLAGRSRVIKLL